jgi:hypothetical protein
MAVAQAARRPRPWPAPNRDADAALDGLRCERLPGIALLYCTRVSTCATMAEAMAEASHDRLTRMLQGDWSGQTLLPLALGALLTVARGYLMIDDTVVEKP